MTTTTQTRTAEKEILQLENRYWKAIQDRDFNAALKMTDDPCLVAGAKGVASIDPATFRNMMNSAKHSLKKFAIGKTEFRQLTDDVALLAYEVHEDLNVDGKDIPLDAAESSVWIRHDGRWICALHTESLKGDPFGRDRAASQNEPNVRLSSSA